ncbi:hypothetical protein NLU66_05845 [Brachybacterium sp. NBEC-018]|uniref:hypothetical protein n=1 Tax=Brachybacterium sp. NBEC-018 TaxID=2996004 RepID=UPI00217520EB|nr:hypothetical protein [Brachybacterium sp. NBEC-018]UVY85120.1 hypothetical protein NLU66_05845 [Brachybacterium sp. NBEC-018]
MFDNHRRRRRERRVRPGDGRALKPFRTWQLLHRTLFRLDLEEPDGAVHRYEVDVHHLADELSGSLDPEEKDPTPPMALYRDGRRTHVANPPAAFPVPGGVIEVARTSYGLSRMHHVPDGGEARLLTPHPRSAEGLRARLGRRFPLASRVLGAIAIVVLLVSLAVTIPQIVELVTSVEVIAARVGTFTSPISLSAELNTALVIAGALAATERALTLRNHWLIDADTTWTSFT